MSWILEWVRKNICYQADEKEIRRIAEKLQEEALSFEMDPNYEPSCDEDSESMSEDELQEESFTVIRDKNGFYRIA